MVDANQIKVIDSQTGQTHYFACRSCIDGHRAPKCNPRKHRGKVLYRRTPPGRPARSCEHTTSQSCDCAGKRNLLCVLSETQWDKVVQGSVVVADMYSTLAELNAALLFNSCDSPANKTWSIDHSEAQTPASTDTSGYTPMSHADEWSEPAPQTHPLVTNASQIAPDTFSPIGSGFYPEQYPTGMIGDSHSVYQPTNFASPQTWYNPSTQGQASMPTQIVDRAQLVHNNASMLPSNGAVSRSCCSSRSTPTPSTSTPELSHLPYRHPAQFTAMPPIPFFPTSNFEPGPPAIPQPSFNFNLPPAPPSQQFPCHSCGSMQCACTNCPVTMQTMYSNGSWARGCARTSHFDQVVGGGPQPASATTSCCGSQRQNNSTIGQPAPMRLPHAVNGPQVDRQTFGAFASGHPIQPMSVPLAHGNEALHHNISVDRELHPQPHSGSTNPFYDDWQNPVQSQEWTAVPQPQGSDYPAGFVDDDNNTFGMVNPALLMDNGHNFDWSNNMHDGG